MIFHNLFTKIVVKAKKEAPAPPHAKPKWRLWKIEKVVPKVVHSQQRGPILHPPSRGQCPAAPEAAQIPLEEHACKKQAWPLHHHQIVPYHWVNHREDWRQHTCARCVNQGQQATQAMKKFYDIDEAKANALVWPDGLMAYVQLNSDYDALDAGSNIGII